MLPTEASGHSNNSDSNEPAEVVIVVFPIDRPNRGINDGSTADFHAPVSTRNRNVLLLIATGRMISLGPCPIVNSPRGCAVAVATRGFSLGAGSQQLNRQDHT